MDINHPMNPMHPINSLDYSILDFLNLYGTIILLVFLIGLVLFILLKR